MVGVFDTIKKFIFGKSETEAAVGELGAGSVLAPTPMTPAPAQVAKPSLDIPEEGPLMVQKRGR